MDLHPTEYDEAHIGREHAAIEELDASIGYYTDWVAAALETISSIDDGCRDERIASEFARDAYRSVIEIQALGAWWTKRDITIIRPLSVTHARQLLIRALVYLQLVEGCIDDSDYYDAETIRSETANAIDSVIQTLATIDAHENNDSYYLRLVTECKDMVDSW